MRIRLQNIIIALGIITVSGGCGAMRCAPPEPVKTDLLFGSAATADTVSLAGMRWNELFTDPSLRQLLREGIGRNYSLQIAMQKVLEAEAYLAQSKAALLPDLSLVGSSAYSRNSESLNPNGPRESETFQLGLQASWEIDIWGKLRSSQRAEYANLLYSDAGRKAVQTRLVADIATEYYRLLALDAQLAITEETVRKYIDLVETMKVMKESGKVTGAAVMQSEAARYSAEITIPDLKQKILEAQNSLCLLVGRTGGTPIERGKLDTQPPAPMMRVGIPALLLHNRPDVLEAQYLVLEAYEATRSARANFYPALTITASNGFTAGDLDKVFNPGSVAAAVVGGLTQPIFRKRANITRFKVSQARQEEAVLSFKITLLNAGNEVQNALGSYHTTVEKTQLREKQMDSLTQSVDYTRELLTYGSANYTEVLTAQQGLLSARLSSVNDRLQQLQAVVSLYRALGGGWKED
jgi:NodT family efflux transporter outer membrane factor (OMF) lipoprotein